jgi:hypothetical protein
MKKIIWIPLLCLTLSGCFKDETIIIDENNDELLHSSSELTFLMREVMAHDTTKDFLVTKSNCFTINFPYQLKVDGEVRSINHLVDIEGLTEDHDIEYLFPIEVSFVNYTSNIVHSIEEFEHLQQKCTEENLDYHKNNCATFIYPIEVAVYDSNRQRFRTETIAHDFDGFQFIESLQVGELYSINYPTDIITHNENHFTIQNNTLLETHFKISSRTCN